VAIVSMSADLYCGSQTRSASVSRRVLCSLRSRSGPVEDEIVCQTIGIE
jgi:hypothetical protein